MRRRALRGARRTAVTLLGVPLVGIASVCAPPRVLSVSDPSAAHRFEIIDVGDSTFRFLAPGVDWVRPGDVGIAVDPRRHDALVARFSVQGRLADTAMALVTGQTARVTAAHVALMDPPTSGALRQRAFWLGAGFGAAFSAFAALLLR